jgi:O-methyltransferase
MKFEDFYNIVQPYSMTSKERINELFESLEYLRKNEIKGDFVECGVWKGGNILGIIEYLDFFKMTDRNVWLYDTFQGMTEPQDIDVDLNNHKAKNILDQVRCFIPIDEVQKNLSLSKFPKENIKYIIGDVEQTLKYDENLPLKISLLRLDTDWYQSTKIELEILYPKLLKNGVLIVDDYGHWKGSKKAVDDYFNSLELTPIIKQVDYTAIKIIK